MSLIQDQGASTKLQYRNTNPQSSRAVNDMTGQHQVLA